MTHHPNSPLLPVHPLLSQRIPVITPTYVQVIQFVAKLRLSPLTVGTALHDGTRYVPHQLMINASDEYGNWNTATVNITVWRNGDVNGDGVITLYDATYLAKWYFNQQGFEYMPENVADVNGDCIVTLYDATYLAKWYFNQPGFERLR
jgi:hypothetical protein